MLEKEVIHIEYCSNCKAHNWCANHSEEKYRECFTTISKAIQTQFPKITIKGNALPNNYVPIKISENKYYDAARSKYVYFPAVGAFEITFRSQLLYSKKKNNNWPDAQAIIEKLHKIFEKSKKQDYQLDENTDGETTVNMNSQYYLNHNDNRKTFTKINKKQPFSTLSRKVANNQQLYGEFEKLQKNYKNYEHEKINQQNLPLQFFQGKTVVQDSTGKKQIIIKLDSIQQQPGVETIKRAPSKKELINEWNTELKQLQNKFNRFQQKVKKIHNYQNIVSTNRDKSLKNSRSVQSSQINEKSIHNANSRLAEKIVEVNEIYGNHAFLQKFYNNVKLRKIQEYVHASQEEKNIQLKKIYGMGDKHNKKLNHRQTISQDESQEDNLRQHINYKFKKQKIVRGSGQISREKLSNLNNKHKSLQYQQNQFRIRERMQNKHISVDKNMRNRYQINEQGKQQNKSELYVRNKSKLQSTMQVKNRKQSQSLSKNDKNFKFSTNSIQKRYRGSKNMQRYQIINGKFDSYNHSQKQHKAIQNFEKNFTGKARDSNAIYPFISNTEGSPYSEQKYNNSRIVKKSKNSFNTKAQNAQNVKFRNHPSKISVRQSKQSKNSQINNRQFKEKHNNDQRRYQQRQNFKQQFEDENDNEMKQQEPEQDHIGNDNMFTIKLRENQDQSIDESNVDQRYKINEQKHQVSDEQYQQQKQNIQKQHKSKRLYDSIHHQKSWRHFRGDSKLLQRHNKSILSQTSRNYPKQRSLSVKENQTQRKSLFHHSASKIQKSNRNLKNSRFSKPFQKQEKANPIKSNRQNINDKLRNSRSIKNQKVSNQKSKRTNNNINSKRSNHKNNYEENLNIYAQPEIIQHKSNNSRIKVQQQNNIAQNNKPIKGKAQQQKIKSKTTKNLNSPLIEKTINNSNNIGKQDFKIKQKSMTTQQPKSINHPTNYKQMKNKQKAQSMIAKKGNSIISEKSIKIKQQKMKAPGKAKINSVQNLSSIKTVRQYSLEENLNPKDNVGAQARSSQNNSSSRSHGKQTKDVGIQKNHYTCKFIQTDIDVDPIISITQAKNNNQSKNIEQEQLNTIKREIEQTKINYPQKCAITFKNQRAFILNSIFGQQITQQSEEYLKTIKNYKIDSQVYPQQEIKSQYTKWTHLTKIITQATLFDNKSLKSDKININEKNQNFVKTLQMLCFKNQFIILRLFQNAKTWKNGMFGVWLCHHYQWKCVKINDLVPIGQSQQPQCTIHSQNQYWPTILEKALAILVGGYRQLQMLTTGQIFHLLTGSNYLQFKIREDATKNEKLIRFLSQNQKKNFIIHAQKTIENLEQQSKIQNTIYYLLNTKVIDENQQLIRIKENNKEPVWIKLQKFASIFHHAEVLMLRVHHNFVQCPLKSTQNSIFVIYQLAFTQNLFGCLTVSSQLCTNLKVYLYRDQGQSVLRLVGQASQKNKKQLFFDCCFNEGKYYLFVECGNIEIRLTYFGEGIPKINLKQSVRQQDLKNQYIQYVPLKELPKNSPQKSVPKFLSSLSSSGFKNSLQSNSRVNKRNSLSRLRQHFIQYLLAKK